MPHKRILIPIAIGLAYAVAAAVLAIGWHPIEINGPESDSYVDRVEDVLAGRPGFDGYHPTHLPLLGAGIVAATGCTPFTALRLISAASGGILVALAFCLASRFGSRAGAFGATAMTAVQGGVLLLSVQAATDAMAAALALAMLLAAVRTIETGQRTGAFATGLFFGLALGTRLSVIGLAPALLAPLLTKRRWSAVACTAAGVVLGHAPHGILAWLERGSPLHNDNWRNLVLKAGSFDGRLLLQPGVDSLSGFLHEHGLRLCAMGAADLWRVLSGQLGWILLGGGPALLAVIVTLAVVGAMARLLWRDRAGRVLVLATASYTALVCLTFTPEERSLLPVLPVAAVALAGTTRDRSLLGRLCLVILVLVATIAGLRLPDRLREFVDRHPQAEIEAATALASHPEVTLVATTYRSMRRCVPFPVAYVYSPALASIHDLGDLLRHLRSEQGRTGANGMAIGRRTAPEIHRWLRHAEAGTELKIIRRDEDVVLLILPVPRIEGEAAMAWFGSLRAEPSPWSTGPLSVQVDVADAAAVARIVEVSVAALAPDGREHSFALTRQEGRHWQAELAVRPPPGTWQLQARLRLHNGTVVMGPTAGIVVQ